MYGPRTTELITGTFVGDKSDQFQNLSHRNHGTNGLEINAGHWLALLELPAQIHHPAFQGIQNLPTEKTNSYLDFSPLQKAISGEP